MTLVADTSAIVALLDRREAQHGAMKDVYKATGRQWILPWAILPEVDYLAGSRLGSRAQAAFLGDLVDGAWIVEWGESSDLARAQSLAAKYPGLDLGLVDASVMAVAERVGAAAIVTLDLRHFAAVKLLGRPRLLPRDYDAPGPREASVRNRPSR